MRRAGLQPIVPQGGFFIMADTSGIDIPQEFLDIESESCSPMTRDWAFCRFLTEKVGVAGITISLLIFLNWLSAAIPPSAFYCAQNKPLAANLARFAFCKSDDILEQARERLFSHFGDCGDNASMHDNE